LGSSDTRLSVALVDVAPGHEEEFLALAMQFEALIRRKEYGRADTIRDEAQPLRYYAVRHWSNASAAERCHGDSEVQALTSRIGQVARITQVVNGIRQPDPARLPAEDRRLRLEADRRTGFDRRQQDLEADGERRSAGKRRLGPRRLRDGASAVDLIGIARRAREHAEAAFSHFKVGAALECADGTIVTGCNIENATYGLTICAERVAMFKALSEGRRLFTRIAIVADTSSPTPPCGACRQILWEFGGNLEIQLANLTHATGTHELKDLLPLPFDARLL